MAAWATPRPCWRTGSATSATPSTASRRSSVGARSGSTGDPRSIARSRRASAPSSRARRGELDEWAEAPRDRLALIVLLDQFSRNVFRGTPLAYAQDAAAQRWATTGLDAGMDADLALHERVFFTLPLGHAEDRVLQARALAESERVVAEAPVAVRPFYERGHGMLRKHADVVARFGRFPTRNATLGRASTPEEITYLEELKITGAMI